MNTKIKIGITVGIILVLVVLAVIIGGLIWLQKQTKTPLLPIFVDTTLRQTGLKKQDACATAGEGIMPPISKFGPKECCDGLKAIFGNDVQDCSLDKTLVGLPTCAPCGNGKCEPQYGENHCSCPEDCK